MVRKNSVLNSTVTQKHVNCISVNLEINVIELCKSELTTSQEDITFIAFNVSSS